MTFAKTYLAYGLYLSVLLSLNLWVPNASARPRSSDFTYIILDEYICRTTSGVICIALVEGKSGSEIKRYDLKFSWDRDAQNSSLVAAELKSGLNTLCLTESDFSKEYDTNKHSVTRECITLPSPNKGGSPVQIKSREQYTVYKSYSEQDQAASLAEKARELKAEEVWEQKLGIQNIIGGLEEPREADRANERYARQDGFTRYPMGANYVCEVDDSFGQFECWKIKNVKKSSLDRLGWRKVGQAIPIKVFSAELSPADCFAYLCIEGSLLRNGQKNEWHFFDRNKKPHFNLAPEIWMSQVALISKVHINTSVDCREDLRRAVKMQLHVLKVSGISRREELSAEFVDLVDELELSSELSEDLKMSAPDFLILGKLCMFFTIPHEDGYFPQRLVQFMRQAQILSTDLSEPGNNASLIEADIQLLLRQNTDELKVWRQDLRYGRLVAHIAQTLGSLP